MKENKKVYIIDDDAVYRFILEKQIKNKSEPTQLIMFENGLAAITHMEQMTSFEEELPDVILLDINMPMMDGWQFLDAYLKLVGSSSQRVKLYVVSSSVNTVDIHRANACEAVTGYLIKPVSTTVLSTIIAPQSEREM